MLKYCQHRGVDEDGKIICRKIARGDQEVTLAICDACPAAACNCGNLKFSLEKESDSTLTIRYGNGRTEVLEARPAGVHFVKAACSALMKPVDVHRDCSGCLLRKEGFVRDVIVAAQVDVVPAAPKVIPFPAAAHSR